MLSHLVALPGRIRRFLVVLFFVPTLGILGVFQVLNRSLQTPHAPLGILSLQFAGTPERAVAILQDWECVTCPAGQVGDAFLYAAFGLGLDYLFMVMYSLAIVMLIGLVVAGRGKQWLAVAEWVGGYPALVAALLDGVENFALWRIVLGEYRSPWPEVATGCATVKFSLLALAGGFALLTWLWPRRE